MILTRDELAAIQTQAVEEYPAESCGVVVTRGAERRLVRCRNIQDELHARDPEHHPRDGRTAYYIDPQDLLRIGRLEGEGFAVAVIYHSHVDAGAYFSPTDKRQAMLGDDPAYPDTIYVVTSVVSGRVEAVQAFRWHGPEGDFLPVTLDVVDSRSA
ncbi:MAG: Mov34/MPN/PAD-1 family protein [Candidatus Rokubacteria bacterium]|nr:Mov34/MPN/PAD-1 family protein [Candidatus Rokubacteria bacterium]MBI3825448.1 Mov34/MPN/PAD-1 family protein [Candidatus Rokubacteria bacterium]